MNQADLRELLTSHGRTVRTSGVDQSYCVQLIAGRREPGPNAVAKIAAALGVEAPVVYAACQESVRRASAVKVSPKRRAQVARKGA